MFYVFLRLHLCRRLITAFKTTTQKFYFNLVVGVEASVSIKNMSVATCNIQIHKPEALTYHGRKIDKHKMKLGDRSPRKSRWGIYEALLYLLGDKEEESF